MDLHSEELQEKKDKKSNKYNIIDPVFEHLLIDPPKKPAATGYDYWGPDNNIQSLTSTKLKPVDIAARRHDLDVTAALKVKDPDLRSAELKRADRIFLKKIEKLYAANKINPFEYYASKTMIGKVSQNVYYPVLQQSKT